MLGKSFHSFKHVYIQEKFVTPGLYVRANYEKGHPEHFYALERRQN